MDEAAAEGSNWSCTFGYDAYGNMWAGGSGVPLDSFTPAGAGWYDANNRLINTELGIAYDAAGNQTDIGGFHRTYDGEGRLKTSVLNQITTTYSYDGDGRRVMKQVGAGAPTVYVYDAAGQLAAEYGTSEPMPCTTCYLTVDHLGSTRMLTAQDGNLIVEDPGYIVKSLHDYLPFGEEVPAGIGGRSSSYYPASTLAINDGTAQKFTGKERDSETGLDYFLARYYSGAQGRFTSPDEFKGGIVDPFTGQQVGQPGPLPYADITDPQTINKYAYVRNNPLRYTDPDGHVLDTIADIGFIAYDLYTLAKEGATTTNVLALGADVAGAFIPFATGGGAAVRAARAAERGVEGARLAREGIALGREITGIEGRMARQLKHLDAEHISAAARELKGEIVRINPRDGKPFDHVTEVREAAQGLQNRPARSSRCSGQEI